MADVATKNLNAILDGPDYVVFEKGLPLFDEHEEWDRNGKLIRKFGRNELTRIAKACNNRARQTGDLSPWGAGHTRDDVASEDDQPEIRGFYANFRLGKYGPAQKLAVVADCYVKKVIKQRDKQTGRTFEVDGIEYAKGLPRRSVELWPSSMTIDWVAHLRRSPQRDLGLAAYSRDRYEIAYSPQRQIVGCVMTGSGKLRYQMEPSNMAEPITPVDDPTTAPVEGDMEPEGHPDFVKHMEYMMARNTCPGLKKYASASMASPTNAALPDADGDGKPDIIDDDGKPKPPMPKKFGAGEPDDEELLKAMRNGTGDVRVQRYQKEVNDLKKGQDDLRKELADTKQREKMVRYERDLNEMVTREGIEMDVADELLECGPMGDSAFEKRKERIRKNYSRSPVGARLPNDFSAPGGEPEDFATVHADGIIRYAREHNYSEKHGGAQAFLEAAKDYKKLPKEEQLRYER